MKKKVLIFSIFLLLCIIGTVAIAENITSTSSSEDQLNPFMRMYVNYKYDSTISSLNNSTLPVTTLDSNKFTIPISGASDNSLDMKTDDPNANLTVFPIVNGIQISDNSNYKYLFNIQMNYSDILPFLHDGKIRLSHTDDNGNIDATWEQQVESIDGYVYFKNLPFTSITITAYSATAYGYVPNYGANTVSVINLATGNLVDTVTVGTHPRGVAVNQAGTYVYVANSGSSTISIIRTDTNEIAGSVSVGSTPYAIAVTPDGSKVYVANEGGDSVSAITTSNNAVYKTIAVGDAPVEIVASPDGNKVYVANNNAGTVSVISTSTDTVTATIASSQLGGSNSLPNGIVVSPDSTKFYVASHAYNSIVGFTSSTNIPFANIGFTGAYALAITPDGNKIYCTAYNSDTLDVTNAALSSDSEVTLDGGDDLQGISTSPDGIYYYVRADTSNKLYCIYTANDTVAHTVTGFDQPYGLGDIVRPINPPTAGFTADHTSGGSPLTVQFSDTSTNTPTAWAWTFGDGATSTSQNPTHVFSSVSGESYTVVLTASNNAGYSVDTQTNYITVSAGATPPSVAFTATPTSGVIPVTVQFNDTSGGSPATSWSWSFGDGGTSNLQNPTHQYTVAGSFSVTLVASNAQGTDTTTYSDYISVSSYSTAPVASFTTTPTTGNSPLTVQFTDTSTNSPNVWLWNFGDGVTSASQSPSHQYTTGGYYTVSLTATNDDGSNTITKSRNVMVSSPSVTTAYAYIPNYGTGKVSVVNLGSSTKVKDITVGTNPYGVAVDSIGAKAYITNYNSGGTGSVSVINTTTNTVTNTITVGSGPYGVAVTPTNSEVYVANYQSDTVSVINTATMTVTNTISGFDQPYGIVCGADGTKVYVTNYGSGELKIISTATHTIVGTMPESVFGGADAWLRGIDISPDGTRLYVGSYGNDRVYGVWTANNTVFGSVRSGSGNDVAVGNDGTVVYCTSNDGTYMNALNALSFSLITQVTLGTASDTQGVTVDPDGLYVYVLGRQSNTLYYIYASNNTLAKQMTGFNAPYALGNIVRPTSTVAATPIAAFIADPTETVNGNTVNFIDTSGGAPTSWSWNFGDGETSVLENPTHVYASPGLYTPTLTVTNALGSDTFNITDYISVAQAVTPVAGFTGTPTTGNIPLSVQFSDSSTNYPNTWLWNFGDGSTSTSANPIHTYTANGSYTVSLTASNIAGSNTVTHSNYITPYVSGFPPTASFYAPVTTGGAPTTIQFYDTSTGSPTYWYWSFGDGTHSSEQNPSHVYSADGAFAVTLTVTNGGGSTTMTKSSYIIITGVSSPLPPVAEFSSDVTDGTVPLTVTFTDMSTQSPTSWDWNFGDGTPHVTIQNATHIYKGAGTYTVTLVARNDGGYDTSLKANYINATGENGGYGHPFSRPLYGSPIASFTSDITSAHTPFTVNFQDTSTYAPTSWNWDFGDGTTSSIQNPSHEYTLAGKYSVSLYVTNNNGGNTITKQDYIVSTNNNTASAPETDVPVASFRIVSITDPTVVFEDTSQNGASSWTWDFGDGTSSPEQNPTHVYPSAGDYNVTLTVTNSLGTNSTTTLVQMTPENYGQYVGKVFTKNMTGFDFLSHTADFYTSFMPSWLFWIIILLIPFISMYNRQNGIIIVGVIYLVTGGVLATVMPTMLGPGVFWFFVLGFAGILYKLFVPD